MNDSTSKPKLTAALRKAFERAGAWDSLPDDERTRAAKAKWLAKQAKSASAKPRSGAKKAASKKAASKKAASKKVASKKAASKKAASKKVGKEPRTKAAPKRASSKAADTLDPGLDLAEGYLSCDQRTAPLLAPLADRPIESLVLGRKVKSAPDLGAFLASCPTLRDLSLHDPAILTPLPQRSSVRSLRIEGSSVRDLGFLKGFPALEALFLSFRGSPKLTSFGGIEHAQDLGRLRANGHRAPSLGPLGKLKKLAEYVAESAPATSSLDGLRGCPALKHVNVNVCPIGDLGALSGAKELLALKIRGARITSLAPIFGANKLQTLFAERTKLRELDGIAAGLPALRLLWIGDTKVKDLSPLRGLGSLLELDVTGLAARDFSVLAELPRLKHVDLYDTSFSDLDLLAAMPALVSARIGKTKVRQNDSRVKKLNARLRKEHGAAAGLYFGSWSPFAKIEPEEAAFRGSSEDDEEHAARLLAT